MRKIFATIDMQLFPYTQSQSGSNKFIYGAWVGIESFYRALLRYGSFDTYQLFVDAKSGVNALQDSLGRAGIALGRIKIAELNALPSTLKDDDFTVFFTTIPDLSKLAYLRARYAKNNFPVCGLAFQSTSYGYLLNSCFLNNLIAPILPCDSIISTRKTLSRVLRNLSGKVSGDLRNIIRVDLKYQGRLDNLPLGIDVGEYGEIPAIEARKKLLLPLDKVIISYFGRFSQYDKADLAGLLSVFKRLLAAHKNVFLLLAGVDGQGGYGKQLRSLAKDLGILPNVKFLLGSCSSVKKHIYAGSDIFVSPADSVQESLGITVLEAMASGLPVVVSDWDGYKESVLHGQTGFRVPTYWAKDILGQAIYPFSVLQRWENEHLIQSQSVAIDLNKMFEYLLLLVTNKGLRKKFGKRAKEIANREYDWRKVVPRYEQLWLKLYGLSQLHLLPRNTPTPFIPDFEQSYVHYPTRMISKGTFFSLGENGRIFLYSKQRAIFIPEILRGIISLTNIFGIITFVAQNKSVSLSAIESYMYNVFRVSKAQTRYCCLWMFKKDLLAVSN
ncbi:MAG: glycosyltransferase family 4 protein [Candidatus Omnitrophica bacterium]|nr:glycosyltransferase family 4 protein [Candidatus Omnitrophota bacterium]